MTEQEAIDTFKERLEIQDYEKQIPEYYEAMKLAIQALETMQELKKRNLTVEDLENYMQFEDECVKKGFSFNSLLEAREKMRNNGWIPCSERLPKEDGFYIATLDGEIAGEDEPFAGLAEFEKGKWIEDDEDYKCVIAWKPLPEPYKEREEVQDGCEL